MEDEDFEVAGVQTVRKAGEMAHPSIMKEWRELRERQPDLFSELRVWQHHSG